MATYGKDKTRERSHMGDNCHLKFGAVPDWESVGRSNSWSLAYPHTNVDITYADNTGRSLESRRSCIIEITLTQSHADEFNLIDALRGSNTIEFWGDGGKSGGDDIEIYAPDCTVFGEPKLGTPVDGNIPITFQLSVDPQTANISGDGDDLPDDSIQGAAVAFNGTNEFVAVFAASAT